MYQIRTANVADIDLYEALRNYTTQEAPISAEMSNLTTIKRISNITLWKERWFLSSNAKDIGTLYLMFALFSGLIGTAFSVLIRLELSGPGVQYIADNQLYNSIITAHAIVMIFFMVKFNAYMFNKSQLSLVSVNTKLNDNADMIIDNNNDNKEEKNSKFKYIKVIVENPYKNRNTIRKVTKKQKGIYIWETLDSKNMYVGHSINLYNRISYYFMPSILNTKTRKVLRYLNKHGFNDIKLTIYIMNIQSSLHEIITLEQHFIDTLKPNLNVDLIANSSGYHKPMTQEMRDRLRKQRGIPVYIYEGESLTLLHIFDSKQYMYNKINIHHKSLQDCLDTGTLYLDYFFLSLDLLETRNIKLLTLDEIITLVNVKRKLYKVKHPAAKGILAKFKYDINQNLEFDSLNSLAKYLKGDRKVIREYLKGSKSGYYRGKWKFTYQKKNI